MFSDETTFDDAQARRRFEAARGYLELDMPMEALEEIAPLRASHGRTSAMSEVEMLIFVALHRWDDGLDAALKLRSRCPEHPGGWFQAAYCLHEMARTEEALITLDEAPRSLRQEPLWHYNRGCYLAMLGRADDAVPEVRKAFQLEPELKKTAKSDPDLEEIRHLL